MSNKLKKRNRPQTQSQEQESVFKEAWDNMSNDLAKVLPGFLARRLERKEGGWKKMAFFAVVELLLVGLVGKLIYDWMSKS